MFARIAKKGQVATQMAGDPVMIVLHLLKIRLDIPRIKTVLVTIYNKTNEQANAVRICTHELIIA